MYQDRKKLYEKLEKTYEAKIISYITGDKPSFEAQIAGDAIDIFIRHLEEIGVVNRIVLFLYTRGGNTAAAWNIINLLRMYCEELYVIIPHKAHSSGTLISIGANKIIMTKQATLSPIDPSLNTQLNPIIPNSNGKTSPVSVEAVNGYIELAKNEFGLRESQLSDIMIKLTDFVHPLVLGQVYRSRMQIKMLAKRLLKNQINDQEIVDRITDFLCSDSGSHDYTINRREAKTDLKLNIENPTEEQYKLIKKLFDDFSTELELIKPFDVQLINGAFAVRRCFIESIEGGSDYFVTEGLVNKQLVNNKIEVKIATNFEGWRNDVVSITPKEIKSQIDGGVEYEKSDEHVL